MALITCPECTKEISDQVRSCPNCGYPIKKEREETQKVEISSVNLKMEAGKRKKILTVVSSILVIGVIIFLGYSLFSKQQAIKTAETYATDTDVLMAQMLTSGSSAESLINLTSKVWYNTIYEEFDVETDKFTRVNGEWIDDFNTSLALLSLDVDTITEIQKMESDETVISEMMKKLKNPPEEYTKVYDTMLELYSTYSGIIDLATSPQGNLTSYKNNSSEKINKFLELYKIIETQMPDTNP